MKETPVTANYFYCNKLLTKIFSAIKKQWSLKCDQLLEKHEKLTKQTYFTYKGVTYGTGGDLRSKASNHVIHYSLVPELEEALISVRTYRDYEKPLVSAFINACLQQRKNTSLDFLPDYLVALSDTVSPTVLTKEEDIRKQAELFELHKEAIQIIKKNLTLSLLT